MSKALMKVGMAIDADTHREIIALRAALEPFAREADTWSDKIGDRFRPGVCEPRQVQSYAKAVFSLGDLRRARKLLNGK